MIAEWTPDRIKAVRKALGETQEKFAEHFRLHPESIRTWEQDRGEPSGPATVILEQLEQKGKIGAEAAQKPKREKAGV